MANVLDGDIVVSEFQLHLRYNDHFQVNNFEKDMNILIPPAMN